MNSIALDKQALRIPQMWVTDTASAHMWAFLQSPLTIGKGTQASSIVDNRFPMINRRSRAGHLC